MSEASSGPDLFNLLADEFAERCRRGERPSVSEYAARYPHLAEQIQELFPTLLAMEQLGTGNDQAGGPSATRPGSRGSASGQLGDYRILREIARGGMGVVYEAVQESLGRHVALKVLPHHVTADSVQLERFRREARAAAQLHHTNVVPVFGVGEHDGVHYYAMQYIRGQSLDAVLREVKRLRSESAPEPCPSTTQDLAPDLATNVAFELLSGSLGVERGASDETDKLNGRRPSTAGRGSAGESARGVAAPAPSGSSIQGESGLTYYHSVARLGVQAAEALAYAHHQGILHRDIKPSNLLLDLQGTLWITDFGLAKSEGTEALTNPGDVVGTLRYMAPERFRSQADPRSDIYALGLTLYEMLTLQPVFAPHQQTQLLEKILHEEPPGPRRLDPHVPRDLETVVLKAMAKEPSDRYQTANAVAEDLRRFLSDRPILARRSGPIERTLRWSRRNPAITAMSIALLLALVTGLLAATTQWIRAEKHAENEARARRSAERAEEQTRQYLYVARMNLAQHASTNGQTRRLLQVLGPYQPGTEQAHLRSFEWYYWWRTCHRYRHSLDGQGGQVYAVAFRPGTTTLASGSYDGRIRIWDCQTGMLASTLEGDGDAVRALAYSADGTTLASGTTDCSIKIWDVAASAPLTTWKAEGETISHLAFSPDGKTLATAFGDGTIKLWNPVNGVLKATLKGHLGKVYTVAFSPDGKLLASCGHDRSVRLWDSSGHPVQTLEPGHKDRVLSVAFSPDGTTLASAGDDRSIILWDVATKKSRGARPGHTNNIGDLIFTPDGSTLVSAADDGMIKLWDATTLGLRTTLQAHTDGVNRLAITRDGRMLASAGEDGSIKVWDPASIEPEPFLKGHANVVFSVAISPDSATVVSASRDGRIVFRDLRSGRPRTVIETGPQGLRCIVFSPDGASLASGHADGSIVLRDGVTGQPKATFKEHASEVLGLAFAPDGSALASVSHDRTVKLWDPTTGRAEATLLAPGSVATTEPLEDYALRGASVVYSPDGKTLASVDTGRTVTLWDLATGRPRRTFKSGLRMPFSLAISPDGKTLAAAGYGQDVELWDIATGRPGNPLKGHLAWVRCLAYSPDGKTIGSASDDRTVILWDTVTGEPKTILSGHQGYVHSLAFSADGTTLVCGSDDTTVSVWCAATEAEVAAQAR